MKTTLKTKFKKGAASFYIIASSTLILLVIATSFAAIIITAMTRSQNDDLSQSAYDSALAGIEDAKLAFSNYQSCVAQGATAKNRAPVPGEPLDCSAIMWYVENGDCDSVAHAIGRLNVGSTSESTGGVIIKESETANNNMMQAYTCTKINTSLADYRGTLSPTNQMQVAKVKFDNGVQAKDIKTVRVSWFLRTDASNYAYTNFDSSSRSVVFPVSGFSIKTATPPTISIALVQASNNFRLDDFNFSAADAGGTKRTNRGIVYLVPTGEDSRGRDDGGAAASTSRNGNYLGTYSGGRNFINEDGFYSSNSKMNKNLPYAVYCPKVSDKEFACSVDIAIPKPIGGERSNDNFLFAVTLPYGKPVTDFALEFFCADGATCSPTDPEGNPIGGTSANQARLSGVQIEIDSTGRANDLYRRVEARLEGEQDFGLSVMGPLELLGRQNEDVLKKDLTVTTEYNF